MIHRVRELYDASPAPIKAVAGSIARHLPVRVRYGEVFARTRRMLRAAREWSAAEVTRASDERLRALCASAATSSYWRDAFAACGMPDGPMRAEELGALPLIDRATIRENAERMLPTAGTAVSRKWVTTGGTTDVPLGMWLDKDASAADWAFVTDAWARVGFRLDDKRAVLRGRRLGRGPTRQLFEYEPIRRELYVSTFDLDDEHLPRVRERLARFRAEFIHGYPSAMELLGRSYVEAGEPPPPLRALLAVSEVLYPAQRAALERMYGCRVFSFYGMTEKGAFAAECEHSTDLHVDPLYGILELVDDEGIAVETPGVRGEIVVTGLLSTSTPIIRYRTGDIGVWAAGECACGRPMRRLRSVEGRWLGSEALVGRQGARISVAALNLHSAVFDSVRRYRFVQHVPGVAELLVVPGGSYTEAARDAILAELSDKLLGQVELTVCEVDVLPLTLAGKHVLVDQKVEIRR